MLFCNSSFVSPLSSLPNKIEIFLFFFISLINVGDKSFKDSVGHGTFLNLDDDIKVFLAGGADDPCIVNGGGIDGLYDHLRKRFNNVSIKKFKGMRHEIQNEQCKDELLTLMESFISNE